MEKKEVEKIVYDILKDVFRDGVFEYICPECNKVEKCNADSLLDRVQDGKGRECFECNNKKKEAA